MSFSFQLFKANAKNVKSAIPKVQEGIVGWLVENAEEVGVIEFEEGECFTFFRSLYLLSGSDLLPLIGGSVHEPPSEMEYCCGTISTEKLKETVCSLLKQFQTADPGEKLQPCSQYLQTQGVSEEWFETVLSNLLVMLNQVEEEETVLGLFE